jgi:NitT/TauT family transport system permease protein
VFSVIIISALILLWEIASRREWISSIFFPAPSIIVNSLIELTASGTLLRHISATLYRMLAGLALGGSLGLIVGLSMGWSRAIRQALDPVIAAFHPMPKIAILPLIMIIFGIGEASKVVAVAVAVFFPMLINSLAGVRQINPIYFDVARLHRASTLKTFTRVVLPGSMPTIMAGLRIALNSALLITIAVELVTAREGMGALIWLSWEILRTENLYAGLVVIGVVGILANVLMRSLSQRLLPWQHDV